MYQRCIDRVDRQRIEKLELFDEFEEWHLIQGHYCLVLALKSASPSATTGASADDSVTTQTEVPVSTDDSLPTSTADTQRPATADTATETETETNNEVPGILSTFETAVQNFFSPKRVLPPAVRKLGVMQSTSTATTS